MLIHVVFIVDDGATRGEITIQIIDNRPLMTISSVEPSFQGNQWFARIIGVSNSTSSQVIEFSIFDMLGSLIDTHSYQTNPDGSFDTVWAIPDNLSYGSYNVTSNIHYPNCDVWQSPCVSFVIFDWQGDQDTTPAEYPTVTASAYLNDTSTTGRTLKLAINDWTNDIQHYNASIIMPDGSYFNYPTGYLSAFLTARKLVYSNSLFGLEIHAVNHCSLSNS